MKMLPYEFLLFHYQGKEIILIFFSSFSFLLLPWLWFFFCFFGHLFFSSLFFPFLLAKHQGCKFKIIKKSVTIKITTLKIWNKKNVLNSYEITWNKMSTFLWLILLFAVIHLNSFLLTNPSPLASNILKWKDITCD